MTRKIFIHKINDIRLLSKIQYRARSKNNLLENETGITENKLQFVRSNKDIPGPKALPLFGNWFRFLPFIGKSYFIDA